MKDKIDKDIIRTFTVHETDMKVVRHLKKAILSYKHLENMLNLLKTKGSEFGIRVVDKDEAYTSKTSCLTRDVNDNQARKALKIAVTPNDLNGNRGAKGKKIGHGMYKDRELNKVFNSDLNGAANHIKVGFPETDLSVYGTNLWKVCNPIKIKSNNDFDLFLNQIVKVNSRGDLTDCRTFEQDDHIFSPL